MKNNNLLQEKCLSGVRSFYDEGVGLRSKELKNYTSGDGKNKGMEELVKELVDAVADHLGLSERIKIDQKYFNPEDTEEWDPQRMDLHVWVDDKVALVIETRAWVDKPFYTLKRAVVKNFMELPYVSEKLHEDVEFILVALAIDIKPRLVRTMDRVLGYGDIIHTFKFSPHRRGYKGGNYFDHGVSEAGVEKFITLLVTKLSKHTEKE